MRFPVTISCNDFFFFFSSLLIIRFVNKLPDHVLADNSYYLFADFYFIRAKLAPKMMRTARAKLLEVVKVFSPSFFLISKY
jgi:hypothetical protein